MTAKGYIMSETVVIDDPSLMQLANLHLAHNMYNRKLEPHEKNLYGIPLDKPVGTKALWYRKNAPSGYIRPEQKKFWGKNISVCKINPQDPLAERGMNAEGKKPTYLVTITEYKG